VAAEKSHDALRAAIEIAEEGDRWMRLLR